jgi:hypothetical protein
LGYLEAEVIKVTLKSNSDEALSDESPCHLKLCFWVGEKSKDIMRHKVIKTPLSKDGQQGEIREK